MVHSYHTVISDHTADAKPDEINALLKGKDRDNRRIAVHSVKSSSKPVGLPSLSAESRDLEAAAKSGDIDRIKQNRAKVMEKNADVAKKLRSILD